MRKPTLFICILFSAVWALLVYGCSAGGDNNSSDGNGGSGNTGGQAAGSGGDGGCLLNCGGSSGTSNPQGVIVISPQNVVLNVDNGSIPTQAFTATINGGDVTSQVTWSYDRVEIGTMANSLFTPTGGVGGIGTLTARLNMDEGTTNVTVYIRKVVNTAGLTPQEQADFDNPSGPDPAMNIVYPYNETVFPLAVLAPEMQWNGTAAADVYRLKLTEKYYDYTEFFTAPPPARHLIAQTDWSGIEDSGTGPQTDPLNMSLSRRTGGVIYQSVNQTWHIAQGRLKGSVYYWELPDVCGGNANGKILRIKPDSPVVDQFFPYNGQCWGCHTVSRDGKKLAAEFDAGNGPLYTLDLSVDPVIFGDISPSSPTGNYIFSAFNHTGDKLLASDNNSRTLRVLDAVSGAVLNNNALGTGCGEPAWSTDGAKVAAICGMSGGFWTFDASSGNLVVGDVAADGITVSAPTTIVPQAGAQGRPAYPSFSPGSEWIAFGRPTSGSRSIANGDLWIVRPDGGDIRQLATASSDNKSFNPVFAPLRAGGYFWIVFITRRDYGNTLVNTNRQQLWITAIDDPPTAGDPSHPPFYLRGQEGCGKSENAYYALDPCKDIGQDCESGADCCNGQCIQDGSGNKVCGEPQAGTCSALGNGCQTAADCCKPPNDVECVDGFCQQPPPQ